MISQKMKASARALGVGMLAATLCAPAALAQELVQCPFTSADVDAWYGAIAFGAGAGSGARPPAVTCADYDEFVTLAKTEVRLGPKVIDGMTVDALSIYNQIMIDVQVSGGTDGLPKYTVELVQDGTPVADPKAGVDVPLTASEYGSCVYALVSSQAWSSMSCNMQ